MRHLQGLVDSGNTVVVVEHDMRIIAQTPEGHAIVPLLFFSAMKGLPKAIKWLLAHGASPDLALRGEENSSAMDGQTALMLAARNGSEAAVQTLIEAGAKVSSTGLQLTRRLLQSPSRCSPVRPPGRRRSRPPRHKARRS